MAGGPVGLVAGGPVGLMALGALQHLLDLFLELLLDLEHSGAVVGFAGLKQKTIFDFASSYFCFKFVYR